MKGRVAACAACPAFAPTTAGVEATTLTALGKKPAGGAANLNLTGTGEVRHIYWTNPTTGTIGRADIDGMNVNQSFITGTVNPTGVAVDAEHIYWTDLNFAGDPGTIGRADLNGSNPNQSFITGASFPVGVAVDR